MINTIDQGIIQMENIRPIRPDEVQAKFKKLIPPKMIEVVNSLILGNWDGESSKVLQEDVAREFTKGTGTSILGFYEEHVDWLDFEEIFRQAGWHVDYNSPDDCRNYGGCDPCYIFTKKDL